MPSKSHIIPVPVRDPFICTSICNELMQKKRHYVQSINYPTVPRGEERLRIAPTPFHNKSMMNEFVSFLANMWKKFELPMVNENLQDNCLFCNLSLKNQFQPYPCGKIEACPQMMCVN